MFTFKHYCTLKLWHALLATPELIRYEVISIAQLRALTCTREVVDYSTINHGERIIVRGDVALRCAKIHL